MSSVQVPEGYKQTEVGVIPEDWDIKRLKQISPSQSVGLVINPSSYFDNEGTVPMLVGSQVFENRINWAVANRITHASNEALPASRLKAGDLVTVRVGEPGITAVVPPALDGCNCASMMIVRQHSSFSSLWLCYMMNSWWGKSRIEHVQYGTAQKQFNISDAIDFVYPVPPLAEQRSIAQALSDVDALIAALDKTIEKKRHLKTATMQKLLTGKKRLPGFGDGMGYKQTEVGVIPEDWDVHQLGHVAEVIMGQSPKGTSYNRDGDGVALINGPTEFTDKHPIKVQWTTEPTKLCKSGDLLLCVRGSSTGRMNVSKDEFCLGRGVAAIRATNKSVTEYLTYQVALAIESLLALSAGSTFPSVDGKAIRSITIPCPSTEEQQSIAQVLSDMDAEIASLETHRVKTQSLKQGMMQELLTGRTRLV